MTRPSLVRALSLLATVVLSWAILSFGINDGAVSLAVGDVASRDYFAQRTAEVVDEVRTADERAAAEAGVEPVFERRFDIEAEAEDGVLALFAEVRDGVFRNTAPPTTTTFPTTTTTVPETTTTTPPADGEDTEAQPTTTTTLPPPEAAELTGFVFLDVDGDGVLTEEPGELGVADGGVSGVRVEALSSGETVETLTGPSGAYALPVLEGEVQVRVDPSGRLSRFTVSTEEGLRVVDCPGGGSCDAEPFGLTAVTRSLQAQIGDLAVDYAALQSETVATLVTTATGDVYRTAFGEDGRLDEIRDAALLRMGEVFDDGIYSSEQLLSEQNDLVLNPPRVFNEDGTRNSEAEAAAADVVGLFLQQNQTVDVAATDAAREEARASTPEVTVTFLPGQLIAAQGETLSQLQIDAIGETGAATGEPIREVALGAVLGLLVVVLAFYLARFRPEYWQAPRRVALLGLLLVLAAGAVRLASEVAEELSPYVLPAVLFGYLAAVLFDNRMGLLMAVSLGVLTAVGTRDPGLTVYALLGALTPIGFVSAASTRRAFRNSVVVSAAAVGLAAALVAWFFDTNLDQEPFTVIWQAGAWGFGASLVAALVALAAMPFFESVFDITTTLRLLELTDRNNDALVLIQEQAFGTFNHSLMVGTLADSAAKAIGADNLLARAAAYYHDIGKTKNPVYFIENQFGIPNPHDELPPEESAAIVRQHVIDGVELARKYKIPSEVAEGIVCHHGDAIMRYFYEKARTQSPDGAVDPDLFRHAGHKPRSKEMAIVMLADSVEGACRAVFSEEEPTPDGIAKVVNRVVEEKVTDGQLSASALTLSDLRRVQQAFVEAMIGHYHSRIPYPNFPGS